MPGGTKLSWLCLLNASSSVLASLLPLITFPICLMYITPAFTFLIYFFPCFHMPLSPCFICIHILYFPFSFVHYFP
ncbi:hypothetical protein GDO86_012472 [Hymenochirus boettgeri]|uniref:Uncharacterized protein n=1 Tax=Hymenochirus boettgeri TaxID=247094 RepID=A0A8T2ISP0_9PIPI|nr:hypothetical protein GDO86_012472 [Hymenochirus boettgeri]